MEDPAICMVSNNVHDLCVHSNSSLVIRLVGSGPLWRIIWFEIPFESFTLILTIINYVFKP